MGDLREYATGVHPPMTLLAVLVALQVAVVGWFAFDRYYEPRPVRQVVPRPIEYQGETAILRVDYIKTGADCTLVALDVFGHPGDGRSRDPLAFRPIREGSQERQRLAGPQTMTLEVQRATGYMEIRVVTRHHCGDHIVDRDFAVIPTG